MVGRCRCRCHFVIQLLLLVSDWNTNWCISNIILRFVYIAWSAADGPHHTELATGSFVKNDRMAYASGRDNEMGSGEQMRERERKSSAYESTQMLTDWALHNVFMSRYASLPLFFPCFRFIHLFGWMKGKLIRSNYSNELFRWHNQRTYLVFAHKVYVPTFNREKKTSKYSVI